jgi:sulfofructose kinase
MTMKTKSMDVLCVGMASYDLIFAVTQHPREDEKGVASMLVRSGGGPAANAAVAVARLGLSSAFAGYLGQDAFGNDHLRELEDEGVIVDLVQRGSTTTPLSVAFVKPDGKRSLINFRQTKPLSSGSVDFSNFRPKVIIFDGHEPELSTSLVERAMEWNAKTILDAGSVHQGTRQLAPTVDYLVCSEKFALEYTGTQKVPVSLDALAKVAPSVVITCGENGLLWKHEQGDGSLAALAVPVVDTTGAGDAFHGAFAACIARGKDWEDTLRFSNTAAGLSCTKLGARPGLPTEEEVNELLRRSV